MTRTALLAGPTGLVGHQLLTLLLADAGYSAVRALSRRPLDVKHRKLEVLLTDYADLPALGAALAVDDVFCCLGTTLKVAGSKAAFERVDHGMVVDLARATRAAGARQFLVVSAAGTTPRSANFYYQVKARMERDVAALDFSCVQIVRPSLLLGERAQSRPGERVGQWLSPLVNPLLRGPLARYRAVAGIDVAQALLTLAKRRQAGVHVQHLPLE